MFLFKQYSTQIETSSLIWNKNHLKGFDISKALVPVFPRISTEYGYLLCKNPHSVQIKENTDQVKLGIWDIFHEVIESCSFLYYYYCCCCCYYTPCMYLLIKSYIFFVIYCGIRCMFWKEQCSQDLILETKFWACVFLSLINCDRSKFGK